MSTTPVRSGSPLSLKPRLQAVGLMPGGNYFASSFPAFRVTDSLVFCRRPKHRSLPTRHSLFEELLGVVTNST